MSLFRNSRTTSWSILLSVVVIAAVAWGFYAWRFADGPVAEPTQPDSLARNYPAPASDDAPADTVTALRARRPVLRSDRRAGDPQQTASDPAGRDASGAQLSAAVMANATPASRQEVEITLGQVDPAFAPLATQGIQAGRAALERGDLIAARQTLSAVLKRGASPSDGAFAREELGRIADALLFSRATNTGDPLTGVHVVSSGEAISTIARKYGVTAGLVASINGLKNPNRIYAGMPLKVIHGPFNAVIGKSRHRMDIYLGDVLVRSFHVGLGTNGGTPLGTWTVHNKLQNPDWTDPSTNRHYAADDPQNPIGEHWIGLHGVSGEALGRVGFGIHGTIDPRSIGENMSMGCIRLVPEDVAMVFDLLTANMSRVTIVP